MNFYEAEPAFQDLMKDVLGPETFKWAEPLLQDMGKMAAQTIPPLSEDAENNPPFLIQYDPQGNRKDEVKVHPSYQEMIKLAYGAGLGGMYYDEAMQARYGYIPHTLVFGLGYLFSQGEQGLYCPICMTEGSARLIDLFGDDSLRRRFMPGLTSHDFETLYQGSMLLTEKQGGSDVGANETVARQVGDHWELTGEKWFCSNAGQASVMMVLARPEGAPAGTRGLGLFLMPRDLEDGSRNHFRIDRLKDKLGTRSMPTGEYTLEGAIAYPLGDLSRGFLYMTEMLNLSRTYNAIASLGLMRRATFEAVTYARERVAFGKPIDQYPMVRKTLVEMVDELEASQAFVWETLGLLDRIDSKQADEEDRRLHRLLTPMIKYHTARQAVRFASEAAEILGGNGYIENFITPRLLRDAQVLPIWEGTTNILVLDVLRSLRKEKAHEPLFRRLRQGLDAEVPALSELKAFLSQEIDRLETALQELSSQEMDLLTYHAKTWSDRAIRLYEAVLLFGQAKREISEGKGRKLAILGIHCDRFLRPQVFGEPGWCAQATPHMLFEAIVHHASLPLESTVKR